MFVIILFMWHPLWYVFLLLQCFWLIFVVVIAGLWFCCQICLVTNKCNGYYCRSILRNEMDISRNEVVIYREPNMAGEQSSHHVAVVQQTSWTFGYRLSVGASYKEDLGVLLLFCAVKRFQSFHVGGFSCRDCQTCGKFTYYRCCGVIFWGLAWFSLWIPCPSRAVYPFLLPTSAHVAGCQSVCLSSRLQWKVGQNQTDCPLSTLHDDPDVWYSNSCWIGHSGSRGELVSVPGPLSSSYLRKIWQVNSSVSQLIVLGWVIQEYLLFHEVMIKS